MRRSCLALFSGGLDSILACKILQDQGIEVKAIKCISPFFSYNLKDKERADLYKEEIRHKYGIDLEVVDITSEYLSMVASPPHGYGRYLNPCIDCKILMVKKALSLLDAFNASFIITGEVLGQRPMSQRRDTLRVIERDSGADGILLRPLSARFLKETIPEVRGAVDRRRLLRIIGRARKEQMRLARHFGIEDYPAPAGGCVLADPILSKRFSRIFSQWPDYGPEECVLAQVGRHFLLPYGGWLVVGRNKAENEILSRLASSKDLILKAVECPGPFCILRAKDESDIRLAAAICARYAKDKTLPKKIAIYSSVGIPEKTTLVETVPNDELIHSFMF